MWCCTVAVTSARNNEHHTCITYLFSSFCFCCKQLLFVHFIFFKKNSSLFGDFMPKRTVFSPLLTLHFQLHPTIKISTTTGGHRRGKTFFVPLLHASQTTNTKPSISSLSLISFSSHLFKTNPKHTHVTCPISPPKKHPLGSFSYAFKQWRKLKHGRLIATSDGSTRRKANKEPKWVRGRLPTLKSK